MIWLIIASALIGVSCFVVHQVINNVECNFINASLATGFLIGYFVFGFALSHNNTIHTKETVVKQADSIAEYAKRDIEQKAEIDNLKKLLEEEKDGD